MVAVNDRTAQLGTYLIKLIAEFRHLVGTVLVAGDDLVNRVNDDCDIVLFHGPTYQLGCQLIHRDGAATEVPNVDAPQVLRGVSQGLVYVPETV